MYFDAHYISNTFRRKFLSRNFFLIFACLLLTASLYEPVSAEEAPLQTAEFSSDLESLGIVDEHGFLSISQNGKVVDQYEAAFQIQGISTHNLAWYPQYVNLDTFRTLRDSFSVNTIRLAMYTAESGGYCTSDEAAASMMTCLKEGIDAAIELDMYVIVDWHILSDSDPNTNKSQALAFFEEIASYYGNIPNILYEICNEPNQSTSWDDICSYAYDVIDCIRIYAPDSIIIVGTPTWSQDIDIAALSPIDRDNLLYSLHFYAATHKEELQNKLTQALNNGLAVFVSEFGITEASGDGYIDTESADNWILLLNEYDIGYVYWNLSNKDEACALLRSSCTLTSDWTLDDYSPSGMWFFDTQALQSTDSFPVRAMTNAAHEAPTTLYSSDDYWSFSNGCNVSISCTGTWTDASVQCASYDVTLSNTSSSALNNWRLRITWNEEITPKEYWSCEIGGSGSSRLFVPVDYNTTIPSGSFATFGMIVYGSQTPLLTNVAFE